MRIREATDPERPAVLNVLDGGLLDVPVSTLDAAIAQGDVLVAVAGGEAGQDDRRPSSPDVGDERTERILGVLVLDGSEIVAIVVRRRRRDQGIGTRLVERASGRREELTAEFDGRVRPFWESLGFEIRPMDGSDRLRGRLSSTADQ